MNSTIDLNIDNNQATLIFNRPKAMNTYNRDMSLDLIEAISKIKQVKSLRLLTLRGNGPVFMAGGEVHSLAQLSQEQLPELHAMANRLHEVIDFFRQLPCPVLAVVHGAVAGAGLSIMLSADIAIASASTKFNLAYTQLGASVDGGASYFLPRMLGMRRTMELMYYSPQLTAQQALDLGLINESAEPEVFQECVEKRSLQLSGGPTLAFAQMKQLVNNTWTNSLNKQLQLEADSFVHCAQTNDFKKGVQGFLKKEQVVFNGT